MGNAQKEARVRRAVELGIKRLEEAFSNLLTSVEMRDKFYKSLTPLREESTSAAIKNAEARGAFEREQARYRPMWQQTLELSDQLFEEIDRLEQEWDWTFEEQRQYQIELAKASNLKWIRYWKGKMARVDEYRASLVERIKELREEEKANRAVAFIKCTSELAAYAKSRAARASYRKASKKLSESISEFGYYKGEVEVMWSLYAGAINNLITALVGLRKIDEEAANVVYAQFNLGEFEGKGVTSKSLAKVVHDPGELNIYFDGIGNPDGDGHGHLVISESGWIIFCRPFMFPFFFDF